MQLNGLNDMMVMAGHPPISNLGTALEQIVMSFCRLGQQLSRGNILDLRSFNSNATPPPKPWYVYICHNLMHESM
jgi:hypothetical protein